METKTNIPEHVDILVVGAGVSGIGLAYHFQDKLPGKRYLILEGREKIGGTWDLFRYPGIRSDSDLQTFGYSFKPWIGEKSIADGPAILEYITETAREHGIDHRIRFGHQVRTAQWSSADQRWTVTAEYRGQPVTFTADWLLSAAGYYDYDQGYLPKFDGVERFTGTIIHPQHWPEDFDHAGKRIVVIGSGATAVTLVPSLAERAAHVTMVQRTPTYIMSAPAVDPLTRLLRRVLGRTATARIVRQVNIRRDSWLFGVIRFFPDRTKEWIRNSNARQLPPGFDVDKHFTPPYQPWDQRMCLAPDGDFFTAIREGKASVVTDHITTFTENGLLLESGAELAADVIVTATGLQVVSFGKIRLTVDGKPVVPAETFTYKAMMLTGVPNFGYVFGYPHLSWTLMVELIGGQLTRLIEFMDARGYGLCVPRPPVRGTKERSVADDFSPGYVKRAVQEFPRQAAGKPFELDMDYLLDRKYLLEGPVGDRMRFEPKLPAQQSAQRA